MRGFTFLVDRISTWVGHAFSFLIIGLTLLVAWEVFSRYAIGNPHAWAFDAMNMLYGTFFMMAGAYSLAKNAHVRADILYGFFRPRTQATLDLLLYVAFFVPGTIALTYAGYYFAAESWAINERSNITAGGPPIYPFKAVIPVAGTLLLLQGAVEIIRCLICIRKGTWPSREEDVQEVDVGKLKTMIQVEDEGSRKSSDENAPGRGGKAKIRKELWFGFSLMAVILTVVLAFTPWGNLLDGHLNREDLGVVGLLMLATVVVAIMLGFPTAFTLMGMGVLFAWLAYRNVNPDLAVRQVLDLMVQRAYAVMSNDVLIAIPLFVFMGYLVERAALIDRLFKSLHLALARVPGSLAVATIITCAIFATATGIVGAVVTLMGLLAFPAMLRAGYSVKASAGAVTAGGCLGILIPPSVLLILYGATAGVSVVQLYAGAFFPGFMLAFLYVGYVIVLAKLNPETMPPLPESERHVEIPAYARALAARSGNAVAGLARALRGRSGLDRRTVWKQLSIALLPALMVAGILTLSYRVATAPEAIAVDVQAESLAPADLQEGEETEESDAKDERKPAAGIESGKPAAAAEERVERSPVPLWYWLVFGLGVAAIMLLYWLLSWERLEIFKMLLASFFPLAILITAVLGSIVFGLATPTEAAAVGAFGGFLLAGGYRFVAYRRWFGWSSRTALATVKDLGPIVKESSFLTAKTSAMVCWLFVGSSIFSTAFALLGGQEVVEKWVLSLGLSPVQFMLLSQFIIFLLGWPLEWTEIIVIFMPIFIPLLPHFGVDPLFFGLLVALNLQTAFLSPPVAMAAFYLKGVSPPHVTLNQIFAGMMPFMGIQILALALLYVWPQIGLWLPGLLYVR
jgi:TRAP-type mannitol/chloroaromatic compound transport system permease large subunit/TRAP-type mannitol/chloroaromatic compound transport system permease small subunit